MAPGARLRRLRADAGRATPAPLNAAFAGDGAGRALRASATSSVVVNRAWRAYPFGYHTDPIVEAMSGRALHDVPGAVYEAAWNAF